MQQLTIRMPEEYIKKVQEIAKSSGLKKSDITRMAIKKFIDDYNQDKEVKPYSKAQRLIGVVESGIPDLGMNHRQYLINRIKGQK